MKPMNNFHRIALLVILLGAGRAVADSTGTVEGSIHYRGARAPGPAVVVPASFAQSCGTSKPTENLVVAKDGALANVVVSIPGVSGASPPPPAQVVVEQRRCQYLPHVQAAPVGSTLTTVNDDAVLHNVHLRRGEQTLVNLAMPFAGQKINASPSLLSRTGAVSLKCDAGHTWMNAFIHVFDHPYFAVTDHDGSFHIGGLPAGTYELHLDHETLGSSTRKITVAPGGVTHVDIELK
jgi:hypothetical protein